MSQDPHANAPQQPGGQYYDPNQPHPQGYPTSASSAGYPQSGASAPYAPQGAPGPQYPQQGYPQPGYPQQGSAQAGFPGAPQRQGSGMMQGLLDFGFKQEATPAIGKVAYYAAWVGGLMWWIGTAISHFVMATAQYSSFDLYHVLIGVVTLLLGWIPVVGVAVVVRVFVEFATATIETKKILAAQQASTGSADQQG